MNLIDSAYKIYTNVLNTRLKILSEQLLCEKQPGFKKGRSITDGQLIDKNRKIILKRSRSSSIRPLQQVKGMEHYE